MNTVKQRIIELVPEIAGNHYWEPGESGCKGCGVYKIVCDRKSTVIRFDKDTGGLVNEVTVTDWNMEGYPCTKLTHGPITLADVLRAIQVGILPWSQEIIMGTEEVQKLLGMWNLFVDFDHQTPELVAFVGKLLGCG